MFGFIPTTVNDDTTIFYGNNIAAISDATTTLWQTWSKPTGVKFVRIMAIGAGGGGGVGWNNSGQSGGGGGGGSGGISIVTIPAVFLPDTLYVFVAPSIPGLTSATTPTNNRHGSIVAAGPSRWTQVEPNVRFRICIANSGDYGGSSTSAGGGGGGTGASAAIISDMPLATSGKYELYAGVNGLAGGQGSATPAAGGSSTPLTSSILSGGAGGGSKATAGSGSANGGNQTASGILPLITGGISTSIDGGSGVWNWKPLCGTGGAGGYGSVTGGAGGDGAYGCGGGGSGADATTVRRGGAGGSGLVIISCW